MSNFPLIKYDNNRISFDCYFTRFNVLRNRVRARQFTLNGSPETLNWYDFDRLQIVRENANRALQEQINGLWGYARDGSTFELWFDQGLATYLNFEGGLSDNNNVAATFARATTGLYLDPKTGLLAVASSGAVRLVAGRFGRGLLIEHAATNALLRSEEFDHATWTKTTLTVTADTTDTLDPAGGTSAEKLVPSAATGTLRQDTTTSISSKDAVFTVYLRSGTIAATSATLYIIRADTGATLASQAVTVSKDWERHEVTYESAGSIAANFGVKIELSGSGEIFYGYGAQLEAVTGDFFPTAYITTTSAAATRNGEVCTFPTTMLPDEMPTGTIRFWFKPQWDPGTFVQGHFIDLAGVSNNGFLRLSITPQHFFQVELYSKDNSAVILQAYGIDYFIRDEWVHVAVTWDYSTADALKIYLNGVLQATGDLIDAIPDRIGTFLQVGGASGSAGFEASGVYDDLELRTDILSAVQLAAAYNAGKPLGYKRNYWPSLVWDEDSYEPELLPGHYSFDLALNFTETF